MNAAIHRVAGLSAAILFAECAVYSGATATVPAAVAPAYADARAALDENNYAEAARILDEALAKLPPETDGIALLQLTLGTAHLRAGQPAKAIAPLEKAADRDSAAIAPLADALRGNGRNEEARRTYEKAAAGDALNARYSRARIAELDSATEKDPQKAAALLFASADAFVVLGGEDASYYEEASKLYESIARNKQWRGESTARAIYLLGEVQRLRKALPEAIAYYQRCFVSWARYPAWCARAYLRASESFEALGRRAEAKAHLFELVRKADKYSRLPEYNEAKTRLRAWGETVP